MRATRSTALVTALLFMFWPTVSAFADDAAVMLAGRYGSFVAHVEVIGDLYNGEREIEAGSGLLVGGNLVITNNHILPDPQNYKTQIVNVRLGTRLNDPLAVSAIVRDPERDLALLVLAKDVSALDAGKCAVHPVADGKMAPAGTTLYLLGYPLNQDLSIASGLVSNQTSSNGERWQTDTVMNPGNSGGPAFTSGGLLAGIAVGGIVTWSSQGEVRRAEGVNFIIPSTVILASPILAQVQALTPDRNCWKLSGPASDPIILTVDDELPGFSRSFTVSRTKDDHPYPFKSDTDDYPPEIFTAEPGYRLTECVVQPVSANHANTSCKISDDGVSATFNLSLTSGPLYDQWRGWWDGTVILKQEKRR